MSLHDLGAFLLLKKFWGREGERKREIVQCLRISY